MNSYSYSVLQKQNSPLYKRKISATSFSNNLYIKIISFVKGSIYDHIFISLFSKSIFTLINLYYSSIFWMFDFSQYHHLFDQITFSGISISLNERVRILRYCFNIHPSYVLLALGLKTVCFTSIFPASRRQMIM